MSEHTLLERIKYFLGKIVSQRIKEMTMSWPRVGIQPDVLFDHLSKASLPDYSILLDEETLFGSHDLESYTLDPPVSAKLVLYGYKPMTLIHGEELYLRAVYKWAKENNLSAVFSPFEFDVLNDERLNGYKNLITSYRSAKAGSGAWRALLLSHDPNWLATGWVSLTCNIHLLLGRLLGFPLCCCEHFERNWQTAVEYADGDLGILSLRSSTSVEQHWSMNIFSRYFGYEFIQHFPCTFSCKSTLEMAKGYEYCLQLYEPQLLQQYKQEMSRVVLLDDDGICMVHPRRIVKQKNSIYRIAYDDASILSSNNNSVLAQLMSNDTSFVYDTKSKIVQVGKEAIQGSLSVFR